MSHIIESRNDWEYHFKWNRGLILRVLLLTVNVKQPVYKFNTRPFYRENSKYAPDQKICGHFCTHRKATNSCHPGSKSNPQTKNNTCIIFVCGRCSALKACRFSSYPNKIKHLHDPNKSWQTTFSLPVHFYLINFKCVPVHIQLTFSWNIIWPFRFKWGT